MPKGISPEAHLPSSSSPELNYKMLRSLSKDILFKIPFSLWIEIVPILQKEHYFRDHFTNHRVRQNTTLAGIRDNMYLPEVNHPLKLALENI